MVTVGIKSPGLVGYPSRPPSVMTIWDHTVYLDGESVSSVSYYVNGELQSRLMYPPTNYEG